MYNEKIKNRYIQERHESVTLPLNYLQSHFRRSEKFEIMLETDISNFSVSEILAYYKSLNMVSAESLTCLNTQLKLYTQWCMANGLLKDNQNHFTEIDADMIYDCVNRYLFNCKIVTKEEIYNWLDQLANPQDRFVLLALFEIGKSKNYSEITKMRFSNIQNGEVVLCTGRKVKISDKLYEIAKASNEEQDYYAKNGTGRTVQLIDSGYIIKTKINAKEYADDYQKGRNLYMSLFHTLDYVGAGKIINPNAIVESGKLHMIKTRAKELGITPKDYIYSAYIKEVENQYNCKMVRSQYVRKYSDFL